LNKDYGYVPITKWQPFNFYTMNINNEIKEKPYIKGGGYEEIWKFDNWCCGSGTRGYKYSGTGHRADPQRVGV
jgi:hypothetical protein